MEVKSTPDKCPDECDICRGLGFVVFPVRAPIRAFAANDVENGMPMSPAGRSYPCPASAKRREEEVKILTSYATWNSLAVPGDASEHHGRSVRRTIAANLTSMLLEHNLVHFSETVDQTGIMKRLAGRVGVVARGFVEAVQQKVAEGVKAAEFDLAEAVIDAATKDIRNWGSDYQGSGGSVPKGIAIQALSSALAGIRKNRSDKSRH